MNKYQAMHLRRDVPDENDHDLPNWGYRQILGGNSVQFRVARKEEGEDQ